MTKDARQLLESSPGPSPEQRLSDVEAGRIYQQHIYSREQPRCKLLCPHSSRMSHHTIMLIYVNTPSHLRVLRQPNHLHFDHKIISYASQLR
jgi:hypothetical protein